MKNETSAPTRYAATLSFNVRDPQTGRMKTYIKGQKITAAAYAALPSSIRSRFTPVASVGVSKGGQVAGETVTDDRVLQFFLDTADRGEQLEGSYTEVWSRIALELDVVAPWAHFRGLQIARVGRAFENRVGYSFGYLCPELVGSDWVSDLA